MYARHGAAMLSGSTASSRSRSGTPSARSSSWRATAWASSRSTTPTRRDVLFRVRGEGAPARAPARRLRPERIADYSPSSGSRTRTRCSRASTSFRRATRDILGRAPRLREYWDMTFAPEERPGGRLGGARPRGGRGAVRRQMVVGRPARELPQRRHRLERDRGDDGRAHGRQVTTYTVGSSRRTWPRDRSRRPPLRARDGRRASDVDYHEQILEPNIVDLLPKLVWHMDEPIADSGSDHYLPDLLGCARAADRDPERDGRGRDLRRLSASPRRADRPRRGHRSRRCRAGRSGTRWRAA